MLKSTKSIVGIRPTIRLIRQGLINIHLHIVTQIVHRFASSMMSMIVMIMKRFMSHQVIHEVINWPPGERFNYITQLISLSSIKNCHTRERSSKRIDQIFCKLESFANFSLLKLLQGSLLDVLNHSVEYQSSYFRSGRSASNQKIGKRARIGQRSSSLLIIRIVARLHLSEIADIRRQDRDINFFSLVH